MITAMSAAASWLWAPRAAHPPCPRSSSLCGTSAQLFRLFILPGSTPLIQEELNGNECGWAALATETDPGVLSCLLWTWLEKLRVSLVPADPSNWCRVIPPSPPVAQRPFCSDPQEPVLDGKDVNQLNNSPHGLKKLHKVRLLRKVCRMMIESLFYNRIFGCETERCVLKGGAVERALG